jgi:uncharacterized protein
VLILGQLLLVVVGAGLVGLALFGLPGTWLCIGACILAEVWTDTDLFLDSTLIVAVVLAVLGEVVEFSAGSAGARKAGASKSGALGALAGGIVGAVCGTFLIPIPVLGTLAGASLGAFSLSALVEHRGGKPLRGALRAGGGAAAGQLTGLLLKLAIGVGVWVILAVAAFVP